MQRWLFRIIAKWYVPAVIAVWTFEPELRRLFDWQLGYHSLPILALLPLLSLFPGVYFLKREWPRLGSAYRAVLMIWFCAFGYAYIVSLVSGQLITGLYDLLLFVLPAGFGALLSLEAKTDFKLAYERTAQMLLWFAALASLYGIYQYVSPPAWDVLWVQNSGLGSIGQAVPFGLRVFGPLNAPGSFADFLAIAILANVPRLRLSRIGTALLVSPCLVALALTLVREAWIGLFVGLIVYVVLSPRRNFALLSLATISIATVALSAGLMASIKGSENGVNSITDRFTTFSSLDEDNSVLTRQRETNNALTSGVREPLGQGLGSVGTSAKLSDTGTAVALDNGYLARFTEMGVAGTLGYLLAIVVAFWATVRAYLQLLRRGDRDGASFAAFAVAIQLMLVVSDAAGDHHVAFTALFFWYSLFIASSALRATGGAGLRDKVAVPQLPSNIPAFGAP